MFKAIETQAKDGVDFMGFALYLDELRRLPDPEADLDADLLLEYRDVAPCQVAEAVERYTAQGQSVLAYPAPAPGAPRCGKRLLLDQTGLREVASWPAATCAAPSSTPKKAAGWGFPSSSSFYCKLNKNRAKAGCVLGCLRL